MDEVELKPDGRLTADTGSVSAHPLRYLGHRLNLAGDCRLRAFFRLIDRYDVFGQLSHLFQLLRSQYDRCPADGCLWDDFEILQFSKTVEMIGYPGRPKMEIYHTLLGINANGPVEIRQLPLNVLLDMPLNLGPLEHKVFGDRMDTMRFETVYTLFEFIDGMAWALSFHGTSTQCLTGIQP